MRKEHLVWKGREERKEEVTQLNLCHRKKEQQDLKRKWNLHPLARFLSLTTPLLLFPLPLRGWHSRDSFVHFLSSLTSLTLLRHSSPRFSLSLSFLLLKEREEVKRTPEAVRRDDLIDEPTSLEMRMIISNTSTTSRETYQKTRFV